jgi:predicted amidohydrolase
MSQFTIALLQMRVEGGDRQRNLLHAEELLADAASHGAEIALLPEAMDLGWTHPSCMLDADSIPEGKTCRRLQKWQETIR